MLNKLMKFIKNCEKDMSKYDGDGNKVKKHSSLYPYHITKKILMILLFSPSNFKNRTNDHKYIQLTIEEIKNILSEFFDTKISNNKLRNHLDMLSINFMSMYGNKNHILAKIENDNETRYQFRYQCEWKKIGFTPNFGQITIKFDDFKKYGERLPEMIIMSIFIISTQTKENMPNLILNEKSIEKVTKLNKFDIDTICSCLNVIKFVKFDQVTKSEKYLTDIQKGIRQDVMRGIHFNDDGIETAYELLKKLRIKFNWENIFLLKELVYHNNLHFNREQWKNFSISDKLLPRNDKNFSKIKFHQWDKDVYNYVSNNYSQENQINCFFREIQMSKNKALDLQTRYSNGIRSKKFEEIVNHSEESDKQCSQNNSIDVQVDFKESGVNDQRTIESSSESIYDNISKEQNFQDFCKKVRDLFDSMKKEKRTQFIAHEIKENLVKSLNVSKNFKKDIFIEQLNRIEKIEDILKTPIFTKNCIEYRNLNNEMLEIYFQMKEHNLKKDDTTDYLTDNDVSGTLNEITELWVSDLDNYDHESYVKAINEAFECKNIRENHKKNIEAKIERVKNKKLCYDLKKNRETLLDKLNVNLILLYILQYEKYEDIESMKFKLNRNLNSSTQHYRNTIIRAIDNTISGNIFKFFKTSTFNEEDYAIIKEFFYCKEINHDNIKENMKLIDQLIEKSDLRKKEDEERRKFYEPFENSLNEKLSELGLTPEDIGYTRYKGFIFKLVMKKTNLEEITKELLGY